MEKVLFFDIDGTIMYQDHDENIIPEGLKEQVERLKNKGYGLFIASGRPKGFVSQRLMDVGFNGFVLCNGAHVMLNGETIFEKQLEYNQVVKLKQILESITCQYDYETSSYCYIDRNYKEFTDFFHTCDINNDMLLHDFDEDEVMHRTLKMEINVDEDKHKLEEYIKNEFKYDGHGTSNTFEIYDLSVSKAVGISKVLEKYNIPVENCYAFGDGLNDMEMVKFAGHGIAMGNAVQPLKDIADEIIGNVDENGLVEYLKTID